MLAKTDTVHYERIANAIREKNGKTEKYLPSEMAQAVLDLYSTDLINFKKALVDQLNEQFDLGLTYDSTTDEILYAISTVEDGAKVTQFFIDLLNSQLDLQLEYDDSEETITNAVTAAVQALKEIEENYNYLVDGLLSVIRSDNNG